MLHSAIMIGNGVALALRCKRLTGKPKGREWNERTLG
jgi:hypothetical protein